MAHRDFGHRIDRLRACEQAQGPSRWLAHQRHGPAPPRPAPTRVEPHMRHLARGIVRVPPREGEHAVTPKPRRQAIDQFADRHRVDLVPVQARLRGCQRFGDRDRQPDQIEAEPRIDRIGKRVQTFVEQFQDRFRRARRCSAMHRDAAHNAVAAEQRCLERAPTCALFGAAAVPPAPPGRRAPPLHRPYVSAVRAVLAPRRNRAAASALPAAHPLGRACGAASALAPRRSAMANALEGRSARSPTVFSPARASARAVASATPSAATGKRPDQRFLGARCGDLDVG